MAEAKDNKNFKDSLKATSLLGGVQVISIVVRIISSKIIAILLGTTGIGIAGLYQSTLDFISSVTSFGLSGSAVKNIAEANGKGDDYNLKAVIGIFRRLVWVTGILGCVVCIILSPWLSEWAFGDRDYTIAFIFLSSMLLIGQLTSGQRTVMQGLQKYKMMAKSSLIGQFSGLFVTIPLYFFWGINAIVPVLILNNVIALLISIFYYKKLKITPVKLDRSIFKTEGKNMLVMGVAIGFTGLLTSLIMYLLRIVISHLGGVSEVGLFTAGYTMVTMYVGLVVGAMGTDFYPRLSAVNNDLTKFNTVINNQMEIAFLLLGPIISFFIIFIHLGIIILYSSQFLPAEGMVIWCAYAVLLQMFSWAIAFSFLAKGKSKLFVINETIASIYSFLFRIAGYYFYGLEGLGMSFVATYIIYAIQVYIICSKKFGVKIERGVFKIFFTQLPLVSICLILMLMGNSILSYSVGVPVFLLSTYLSYRGLNKHMDIKSIIKSKIPFKAN